MGLLRSCAVTRIMHICVMHISGDDCNLKADEPEEFESGAGNSS